MKWAWGELKGYGIRICQDCGEVTLEDETHLCPGSRKDQMTEVAFEIVDAEWPEKESPTKKAIQDFLASGKATAEIKGNKEFLVNVRRTAKTKEEFRDVVELRMVDGRMFIRRKDNTSEAA